MSASLPFFAIPLVGTEDTSDSADCAGEQLEPGFGSGPDTRRFLDSGELDIFTDYCMGYQETSLRLRLRDTPSTRPFRTLIRPLESNSLLVDQVRKKVRTIVPLKQ